MDMLSQVLEYTLSWDVVMKWMCHAMRVGGLWAPRCIGEACMCNRGELDLNRLIGLIPSGNLESQLLNGLTETGRERTLHPIMPKRHKPMDRGPKDLPGLGFLPKPGECISCLATVLPLTSTVGQSCEVFAMLFDHHRDLHVQ